HDQHPRAEADRRMRGERRGDGDRHADHAEEIAAPAGLRIGEAAQRQDEQNAGSEVTERGDVGVHRLSFLWNIASMRCVTRKPPKILTDAKVSATRPSPRA